MKTTKGMAIRALLASFVLIAGLLVSLMLPAASLPVMAGVGSQGKFQVELVDGYPQNDYANNTQTWCYNVTVLAEKGDLSHWDLGLCDEPEHNVKWSNPPATGDSDPKNWPDHGNLIKWDYSLATGQSAEFCFTLNGIWEPTEVEWFAKDGHHWNDTGMVTGPNCAEACLGEIEILKKDDSSPPNYLPGAEFEVDPDPYGSGTLTVVDNDSNDKNPADGMILLEDVPCDDYTITETKAPDGYVPDPDSQTNTVSNGETATCIFTNAQTCTIIYGYKWNDRDHDSNWDDFEPPLNGWTINLAGPESDTAVTSAGEWPDGYYEFRVCTNGDYTINEDILTGEWHRTFPPDPGTYTVSVDVQSGPYGPYNFGNAQTCTIIYGYKWNDRDHDSNWDDFEPPLEDWEIHLDGPVIDVAYTNAEGYYEFTVCDVWGTFTVSEVVRGGWTQSYPSAPGMHQVVVDDLKKEYGLYDFGNWNPVPPPRGVGGEAYPVDKLAILMPWIALFAGIPVCAVILIRRRAQS